MAPSQCKGSAPSAFGAFRGMLLRAFLVHAAVVVASAACGGNYFAIDEGTCASAGGRMITDPTDCRRATAAKDANCKYLHGGSWGYRTPNDNRGDTDPHTVCTRGSRPESEIPCFEDTFRHMRPNGCSSTVWDVPDWSTSSGTTFRTFIVTGSNHSCSSDHRCYCAEVPKGIGTTATTTVVVPIVCVCGLAALLGFLYYRKRRADSRDSAGGGPAVPQTPQTMNAGGRDSANRQQVVQQQQQAQVVGVQAARNTTLPLVVVQQQQAPQIQQIQVAQPVQMAQVVQPVQIVPRAQPPPAFDV